MADKDSRLSIDLLHELFEYKNGKLFWKKDGTEAGWTDNLGYRSIGINRKTYKTHRLIFLFHKNYLPSFIDHIDGDPSNNAIENLREASKMQNSWNQKVRVTNKSGIKGVGWNEKAKAWGARCMLNYKSYFLGRFKTKEEAAKVIYEFREKHQGQFARHS